MPSISLVRSYMMESISRSSVSTPSSSFYATLNASARSVPSRDASVLAMFSIPRHLILFLMVFSIKPMPSRTLVMSYMRLFYTSSFLAASFKSRHCCGAS